MRAVPPTALFAAIAFIAPVTALHAQDGNAAAAADASDASDASEPVEPGQTGLELGLQLGFGSAGAQSPLQYSGPRGGGAALGEVINGGEPYGGGFVAHGTLGYRPSPYMSFGLRGGSRLSSADAPNDGTRALERSGFDAGLYVRAYPLATHPTVGLLLDTWIGLGAVFAMDTQTYTRALQTTRGLPVDAKLTIDEYAVGLPIALGVAYRVHPRVSIGPSFEYMVIFPIAGCQKAKASGFVGTSYCSNKEPGSSYLEDRGYGAWSASLDVRATVF